MNRRHNFQEWQLDPNSIKTDFVQFWRNGVMVTARLRKEHAQDDVNRGWAFVISPQAIGHIKDGQPNS